MTRVLIVCATAIFLMAQPAMAQTDAKAKAVLEKVNKNFKKLKSLQADFTMKISNDNGLNETKKGSFYLKGDMYRIEMGGVKIMTDATSLYRYSEEMGEVTITEYIASEQDISPQKIFAGDYTKSYKSAYDGSKTVNGKACEAITMTAINSKADMKMVKLFIDKKTDIIIRSEMTSKEGSIYAYDISNFKTNPTLNNSFFVFDPKAKGNENVEVVDMR